MATAVESRVRPSLPTSLVKFDVTLTFNIPDPALLALLLSSSPEPLAGADSYIVTGENASSPTTALSSEIHLPY